MADPPCVLTPGTLVVCCTGEYDDARLHGVYRVQRLLTAAVLRDFWAAPPYLAEPSSPRGPAWHAWLARYSPSSFLAWLVTEEYLQPLPAVELSLGTAQADTWHVDVLPCGAPPA
jgi:hypothetical protein